jgi:hypothetical protein
LQDLTAVQVAGKEGRDLVFASQKGLVPAFARDGYRAGAPVPASASRAVEVADVTNSGELDLVTPAALWVRGKEGWRKTEIASGERVLHRSTATPTAISISTSPPHRAIACCATTSTGPGRT